MATDLFCKHCSIPLFLKRDIHTSSLFILPVRPVYRTVKLACGCKVALCNKCWHLQDIYCERCHKFAAYAMWLTKDSRYYFFWLPLDMRLYFIQMFLPTAPSRYIEPTFQYICCSCFGLCLSYNEGGGRWGGYQSSWVECTFCPSPHFYCNGCLYYKRSLKLCHGYDENKNILPCPSTATSADATH